MCVRTAKNPAKIPWSPLHWPNKGSEARNKRLAVIPQLKNKMIAIISVVVKSLLVVLLHGSVLQTGLPGLYLIHYLTIIWRTHLHQHSSAVFSGTPDNPNFPISKKNPNPLSSLVSRTPVHDDKNYCPNTQNIPNITFMLSRRFKNQSAYEVESNSYLVSWCMTTVSQQ